MAIHSRYRPTYYTSPRWLPKTAPAGAAVGEAIADSQAAAEGAGVISGDGSAVATSQATATGEAVIEQVEAFRYRPKRRRKKVQPVPIVITGTLATEITFRAVGAGRLIAAAQAEPEIGLFALGRGRQRIGGRADAAIDLWLRVAGAGRQTIAGYGRPRAARFGAAGAGREVVVGRAVVETDVTLRASGRGVNVHWMEEENLAVVLVAARYAGML